METLQEEMGSEGVKQNVQDGHSELSGGVGPLPCGLDSVGPVPSCLPVTSMGRAPSYLSISKTHEEEPSTLAAVFLRGSMGFFLFTLLVCKSCCI